MRTSSQLNIQHNVRLAEFSSMGVQAFAKSFIPVNSMQEVSGAIHYVKSTMSPYLILGGGSNVLFVDNFDGVIIKNQLMGFDIISESEEEIILKIGAGENWHKIVEQCVNKNWAGIENLALIPGTMGAAPIQNIGAYGAELADVFVELEAFEISCEEKKIFNKNDCKFGYRDSIFKHDLKDKAIITSVSIRLSKMGEPNWNYAALKQQIDQKRINKPTIKDVYEAVIEVRESKLPNPDVLGNNGSFFKNPVIPVFHYDELKQEYPQMPSYPVTEHLVKVPAGWLIDHAGWKGYRTGDAGVHEKQALVLVNYGNASGSDIYMLSEMIRTDIDKKYGISLKREVNVI